MKGHNNVRNIKVHNCLDETLSTRGNILKECRGDRESTSKKISDVGASGYDEHERIIQAKQVSQLPNGADARGDIVLDVTVYGSVNFSQGGEDDLLVKL